MRLREVQQQTKSKTLFSFLGLNKTKRPILNSGQKKHRRWIIFQISLSALVVFALCFLGYGVFGDYFKITQVEVFSGVQGSQEISNGALNYLSNNRRVFLPEQSLFVVDRSKVSKYIEENFVQVLSVYQIEKDWPRKLVIHLQPRTPTFSVPEGENRAVVFGQDGRKLFSADTALSGPGVTILKWKNEAVGVMDGESLQKNLASVLSGFRQAILNGGVKDVLGVEILPLIVLQDPKEQVLAKELEIPATVASESLENIQREVLTYKTEKELSGEFVFEVRTSEKFGGKNFYILLRAKQDSKELERQLSLILNSQSRERLDSLVYLDMRYAERGYLCLRQTPCAEKLPWQVE